MSILDKASLIQIPSGYKSGKLYSIKPDNGDGDFTFSRSSSATRVNSEGLIETAQIIGSELITNGDFATDSDWTKTGLATIANGVASFVDNGTNTNTGISQNILTANKTYKITFDIKRYVAGNMQIVIGATSHSYDIRSGVGSYVAYYTVASGGTEDLFRLKRAGSYPNFDFDVGNVSVKEVIENDVPRLDYSDGSCPSLLLERQSTNLINYSESLSNSNKSGTFVDNYAISPDGTQNATKITATSIDPFFYQSVTLNAATYTASLWVKGIGDSIGKEFRFAISNQTHTSNKYTIPSEWTRFEFTASVSAGSVTTGVEIIDPAVVGDEVLAWGWQLEQSSYATSYIPSNSGSSTTRTADVCNNAGTSATFNSTEGVLFAEIAALANDSTDRRITISDGTTNNRMAIGFDNASNKIKYFLISSNTIQVNQDISVDNITQFNKIAFLYKENDFKLYMNGSLIASDTSGSTFSANTLNVLKFAGYSGTSQNFYGKTKQLMVFDEALSNEELSDLTGQINTSFVQLADFYNYTIL